ncbi:PAS domain-containing protein [Aquimarina sp. D1M17]|uniref:PAS domain-containing sensor histidine kinase n=1 Tax=Aquimarina acroporae TaxID=2937283 RepID=UPI0020C0C030|nr:PAS domain-containing protein [Aquimarina acroporae]MCK8522275.1 PAS domain-containing protein [Aquimarina acroporae]
MKEEQKIVRGSLLGKEENYLKEELYDLIKKDDVLFEFLQESVLDGIWFSDLDIPDNVWMSPEYWTTFGYDPKEMPHKAEAWQNIVFEEDLKNIYANFVDHAKDPTCPYDQIVRFRHKLGHVVWIRCRGFMLRDDTGRPVKMLGAHTDITHIKEKEEELRLQTAFFEQVIEGTDLGTWQWNVQTGETIFNERWAEIIGCRLEELEPVSIDTMKNYAYKKDLEHSNKLLQNHFTGKTVVYECEARMLHKNGSVVWILDKGKVVSWDEDGNPEWMVGSRQEITESKKAYERNRTFIEQAPTAIAMFDRDMNYLAASQEWCKVFDIENQEIVGESHYKVLPTYANKWKVSHRKCLGGTVIKNEEERFKKSDGATQWLSWEFRPWLTDDDVVGGIIIHMSDITKIKREEELQSLLVVAEDQNKRLRNFAHIVSHNLKSHSGNFEMLLDLLVQETPEVKDNEIIRLFKTASENLTETISHLNEVVLMNTSVDQNLVNLKLCEIANKTIESVSAIATETEVTIINKIQPEVTVLGISAYLDSIFLNLITNGIKYSSKKRDSYVSLTTAIEEDFVVLIVEDNGLGINLKKHRAKLFGMYKTFHHNKDARGIGLFITKNQIEAMGGKIEVESEVDRGSAFKIYLKYEKN